jgi:Flp pilus assembly protein TadG
MCVPLPWRQRLESSRGAALVELAASILVIAMLLVFAADFARIYHHVISLETAARAGVQYGASSLANSSDLTGMEDIAEAAAPDTALVASASRTCICASDDASTYNSGVDCTEECDTGQHLIVEVGVNATYTFRTLAASSLIFMPSEFVVTRTATLRAQ